MESKIISPRSLTEIETSQYIGMSRSYLRQARMNGNRKNRKPAPRFIKIAGSVRYLIEELDKWLDQFQKLEHIGQIQDTNDNLRERD